MASCRNEVAIAASTPAVAPKKTTTGLCVKACTKLALEAWIVDRDIGQRWVVEKPGLSCSNVVAK